MIGSILVADLSSQRKPAPASLIGLLLLLLLPLGVEVVVRRRLLGDSHGGSVGV